MSHPDRKRQIHPDPPFLLTLAVMFAILGLICLGLIFSGCASSTLGKSLNVGVAVSGAADIVTTRQAIARGGYEMNPILGQGVWRQSLIKFVGVSGVIAGAQIVERKSPVLAHVLRGITITAWSLAAWHNRGVMR